MSICISADSTCDLSAELAEKYHIRIVPNHVVMGERSLPDGPESGQQAIFAYTAETGELCSTAAPSIGEYMDAFAAALENAESVIHFTVSSRLSSCYQSACAAAADFGGRVVVADSKNLSGGIALLAVEAESMAERGCTIEEIMAAVEAKRERISAGFLLDTLDYMHKGGRCSGVAALGANLLKLKPCIEVKDAVMSVGKKYRGTLARSLNAYFTDRLADENADRSLVIIAHALSDETLIAALEQQLRDGGFEEVVTIRVGAVIACHAGPEVCGLFYFDN